MKTADNTPLDPQAGTHFTGKIFVTPHACDRAVGHFGIDRAQAPMHVMDFLRKSALVDPDVIGEDGRRGRLFAYKRTAFVVALNEDAVITLYPQEVAPMSIRDSVAKVLAQALRIAQRKESRETKRLNIRRAELSVERAECELRRLKTASVNVVAAMAERMAEIDVEFTQIDAQIFEVKREKTTLAKGICSYL